MALHSATVRKSVSHHLHPTLPNRVLGLTRLQLQSPTIEVDDFAIKPRATLLSTHCRATNLIIDRVVGYDVVYEHNGTRYQACVSPEPGHRLVLARPHPSVSRWCRRTEEFGSKNHSSGRLLVYEILCCMTAFHPEYVDVV